MMAVRAPDFIIGKSGIEQDYLHRWYLRDLNIFGRVFGVKLHKIMRDDDDRALHDHPWDNVSVILWGVYREHTPEGSRLRWPGCVVFRRAENAHRLSVVRGPIWTLFITGKHRREWGFHCPKGWRHWTEFVDSRDEGKIGRGCD